jgi:type IV secretory pathway protease TraF
MKKIVLYGLITLAGLSSVVVLARQNFVINITDSLPPGLYSLSSNKTLMRDNLIVFCPNSDQTVQYLGVGDPATRF